MEPQFAFFPVAVMILLALGACGLACRRLVSVLLLVGGGVIALLVLGAIGFTSVRQVRYVEAQQHELRQRISAEEAVLQYEASRLLNAEPIPLPDRNQPVEAPRPSEPSHATMSRIEEITPAASEPLPDWARTTMVSHGDQRLVVVNSRQFADPADARRDALREATHKVVNDFIEHARPTGSWSLSREQAELIAVRRTHTEAIERTAGENDFTVYRTYLLVELSPDVHRQIEPIWRQQVSRGRSMAVAMLLSTLTAIAGLVAGFFRLDDRTSGRYRWPMAFGAMAAAVLLGGMVLTGARHAAGGMRSPDPWPTPPARPVPPHAEPTPPPMVLAPERPLESFVSTTECPN